LHLPLKTSLEKKIFMIYLTEYKNMVHAMMNETLPERLHKEITMNTIDRGSSKYESRVDKLGETWRQKREAFDAEMHIKLQEIAELEEKAVRLQKLAVADNAEIDHDLKMRLNKIGVIGHRRHNALNVAIAAAEENFKVQQEESQKETFKFREEWDNMQQKLLGIVQRIDLEVGSSVDNNQKLRLELEAAEKEFNLWQSSVVEQEAA